MSRISCSRRLSLGLTCATVSLRLESVAQAMCKNQHEVKNSTLTPESGRSYGDAAVVFNDHRCRVLMERAGWLEVQPARARAELLHLDTGEVADRQEQVRARRVVGDDVAVALESAVGAADQHRRRIAAVMRVA